MAGRRTGETWRTFRFKLVYGNGPKIRINPVVLQNLEEAFKAAVQAKQIISQAALSGRYNVPAPAISYLAHIFERKTGKIITRRQNTNPSAEKRSDIARSCSAFIDENRGVRVGRRARAKFIAALSTKFGFTKVDCNKIYDEVLKRKTREELKRMEQN